MLDIRLSSNENHKVYLEVFINWKEKKELNRSFKDKVNYGNTCKVEAINADKKKSCNENWIFSAQNNLKKKDNE